MPGCALCLYRLLDASSPIQQGAAMQVSVTIDIDAAPERVWEVLSDVERWPEWTQSMTSVELLDGGFGIGQTVRVKQPRLPAAVWCVTAFDAGQGFVWEARSLGTLTIAGHRIEPRGAGSRVTLTVRQTGGLVPVFAPITSRFVRRYMEMEAAGLKERSEEASGMR
jgi:uncharacterized protein YndB with AHSA1/START domain